MRCPTPPVPLVLGLACLFGETKMKGNDDIDDRLPDEFPYEGIFGNEERQERRYWSALRDAESAITRIAEFQNRRKDPDGEFDDLLASEGFREFRNAVFELRNAVGTLAQISAGASALHEFDEEGSIQDDTIIWEQRE